MMKTFKDIVGEAQLEIHETSRNGEMMRMRQVSRYFSRASTLLR
jgi:copper(I)-binding protein